MTIKELAIDYKNRALLEGKDAIVLVEDEASERFWGNAFTKYAPTLNLKLIYNINIVGDENQVKTAGNVKSVLKYLPFANCQLILCKDSDYDYLLQTHGLINQNFLFQTYTYSVENYFCYAPSLKDIPPQTCLKTEIDFDFNQFLIKYSQTVYELFVWTLQEEQERNKIFDTIALPVSIDTENAESILLTIQEKTSTKITELRTRKPHFDFNTRASQLHTLGLTPENVYLFLRGHDVLRNIKKLLDSITNETRQLKILEFAQQFTGSDIQVQKDAYMASLKSVTEAIEENTNYFDCFLMEKIQTNIDSYLEQCFPNKT